MHDSYIMANLFKQSESLDLDVSETEVRPRHVGRLSQLDEKRILELSLTLQVDKVKNYSRADIRPDGDKHVCSIDILASKNKKRFNSLTQAIFDALKRCVPNFDSSDYDSIQCNCNQLMKKHTDDIMDRALLERLAVASASGSPACRPRGGGVAGGGALGGGALGGAIFNLRGRLYEPRSNSVTVGP